MSQSSSTPASMEEVLFPPEDHRFMWHMSRSDRYALLGLVRSAQPDCTIEIGTFEGGSLEVLAKYSQRVYSIDINPEVQERLKHEYSNVDFLCGDSVTLIDSVLEQIKQRQESLGLVLIDGDHSAAGVRRDIELILKYRPTSPMFIVMHDSFNPACRRGMLEADWSANPHVHFVEIDFVQGTLHDKPMGSSLMWGGLAVAILLPEERTQPLVLSESGRPLYESILGNIEDAKHSFLKRAAIRIKSRLTGQYRS